MKLSEIAKTLLKEEVVKFFNSNGDDITCLITRLDKNEKTNGFILSFRYYNVTQEIGGFETTLWISNCDIHLARTFCGLQHEWKHAAKLTGGKIDSKKIDNKVPLKFRYENIKNELK